MNIFRTPIDRSYAEREVDQFRAQAQKGSMYGVNYHMDAARAALEAVSGMGIDVVDLQEQMPGLTELAFRQRGLVLLAHLRANAEKGVGDTEERIEAIRILLRQAAEKKIDLSFLKEELPELEKKARLKHVEQRIKDLRLYVESGVGSREKRITMARVALNAALQNKIDVSDLQAQFQQLEARIKERHTY